MNFIKQASIGGRSSYNQMTLHVPLRSASEQEKNAEAARKI